MPDEPEVQGLLELMLVIDARRDARFAEGTVVLLRSAVAVRTSCKRRSPRCTRRSHRTGPQLAVLYGELARFTGSSVVELNRAAALAEAGELEAALTLVERLETRNGTTALRWTFRSVAAVRRRRATPPLD
jgi:RNA polymerase sigma-70 factor (ECF subfamily)